MTRGHWLVRRPYPDVADWLAGAACIAVITLMVLTALAVGQ